MPSGHASMLDEPSSAKQKYALLQARYRARLAERIGELKAVAESDGFTTAAPALLEEIRTRSHQLAGSAGTFGFAGIGDIAAQIERETNMLVSLSVYDTGEHLSRIRGLIADLERLLKG
jgi:HPt (histidine-containing phosphotransfer) domain-containing protein